MVQTRTLSLFATLILALNLFGATIAQSTEESDPCKESKCGMGFPAAFSGCASEPDPDACTCQPKRRKAYIDEMTSCWRDNGCKDGRFATEEYWKEEIEDICRGHIEAGEAGGASATGDGDADGAAVKAYGVGLFTALGVAGAFNALVHNC
ncbi:hypothetical protein CC1G_02581 [Coprinopsis cinerea okayama7|uniref:Extracellular membrane protein CFEM domain-containing protein n=1 Tax=Coprinopsis cinerea (strain Okayama-7 / 130 / ATCC MYA-4618 / FGSC 9003) TaxID=240176 RepID=A8PB80_COPC7|nr:hypothetical protein CC1G_02581 [Coprinopsis cinerea okayama7\|eukprot:XP_001840118.1 hypothetical protein CC1G_02581 [Coprinopsis cinerea okayama7\